MLAQFLNSLSKRSCMLLTWIPSYPCLCSPLRSTWSAVLVSYFSYSFSIEEGVQSTTPHRLSKAGEKDDIVSPMSWIVYTKIDCHWFLNCKRKMCLHSLLLLFWIKPSPITHIYDQRHFSCKYSILFSIFQPALFSLNSSCLKKIERDLQEFNSIER